MDSILAKTTAQKVTVEANRHLFNKINGTYTLAECKLTLKTVSNEGLGAADPLLPEPLKIQQLVEEGDNEVNTMPGNKV